MLRTPRRISAGFSLIELVVTLTLIAITLALAVPAFGKWSADSHVRAASESLINAIRLTQSTAVSQGRTSMFALTTDSPPLYNSAPTPNSPNWFAELNALGGSDETAATLGLILKSTEGTQHAVTITGPALICFNSTGRQVAAAAGVATACAVQPDDTAPTFYRVSRTGATRAFRVLVYLGGRVRLCDEAKTLSSTNPDGCP